MANNWPTTAGKVISSRVYVVDISGGESGSHNVNAAAVQFEYDVNGHHYKSDRLTYAGNPYPATYAAKYPKGAAVTVHYDPGNPSEAVLDLSYNGVPKLLLGIAIVVAYAGYIVWLNRGGKAGGRADRTKHSPQFQASHEDRVPSDSPCHHPHPPPISPKPSG